MKIKNWYWGIVSLFLWGSLYSCDTVSELSPQKYLSWYQTHQDDLRSEKQVGGIKFELTYLPSHLKAIQELGLEASAQEIQQHVSEHKGVEYYQLYISSTDANIPVQALQQNQMDPNYRSSYFAFDFQEHIKLKL